VIGLLLAAAFSISGEKMPEIVVDDGLRPFVMKAATDVAGDLERIFGVRPTVRSRGAAVSASQIVLKKGGTGFENYQLESLDGNRLEITGSDDRGVMFGLYRFASDFLKVDPFWWFARTADGTSPSHAPRTEMRWESISLQQGDPSFRYRGWFINDEDFLNGFLPEENGVRAIDYPRYHVCFGPTVADRLYEAAARAGFNTMVCASYVDILNPDEKRLVDIASSRGFYITMHHQEPVGAGALQLDVHFPEVKGTSYASHPDLWRAAWQKYVAAWCEYPDVIFQLGLRGRKDLPFWTRPGNWADARKVVDAAETKRRAGLISRAMAEQKAMIERTAKHPYRLATQLWMEGADFYHKGLLDVPDGVIVILSDNCPGLKFQPDIGAVEKLPSGRAYGLYYHLAIVQGNHRTEIVPPERTHEIVSDAYRKGAREFLLVNVSNVRPFLYTLGATCEMACRLETFATPEYARRWTEARFGDRAAKVRRAIDLYFAGLECVFSRDGVSSYGSPLPRAQLPVFNDGIVCDELRRLANRSHRRVFDGVTESGDADPLSPYAADPDALAPVPPDQHSQTCQDMRTFFAQRSRIGPRAAAQVAGMQRCLDALEAASEGMPSGEREILFERFGYQAAFSQLACRCLSELSLARDAGRGGAKAAALRHLDAAIAASEAREALDRRYASGVWARWYDRDLIYPYTQLTENLRTCRNELQKGKTK